MKPFSHQKGFFKRAFDFRLDIVNCSTQVNVIGVCLAQLNKQNVTD